MSRYDQPAIGCSDDPSGVVAALIECMRELGPIAKSEKMTGGGPSYNYRGIESIMERLSPLLAKHGVLIVPHTHVTGTEVSPSMPDGWIDTSIEVEWRIYGPDGSWITAATAGVGRDKSDKGVNKAQTQAEKYLMIPLFAIADASSDADGLAYEPHVEPPEPPKEVDKPTQDKLLSRIGKLNDENKEELVKWFREHEVPPIRKLTENHLDDVQVIIDHYETLEDAQKQERAEGAQ